MSSARLKAFAALIVALLAGSAYPAGWSSNGPEGGAVVSLAVHPGDPAILYAGAGAGMFKTENGGASWRKIIEGLGHQAVYSIAVSASDPRILYIAAREDGVFKSMDGGEHWVAANAGLAGNAIQGVAVDPDSPSIVYACSQFFGEGNQAGAVFRSLDGGASWAMVYRNAQGGPFYSVYQVAVNPQTRSVYAVDDATVVKSTDGGATWSIVLRGVALQAIAIDPSFPSIVYAGGYGVWKSEDAGESWTRVAQEDGTNFGGRTNFGITVLAVDAKESARVYAASRAVGVFESLNRGATWTPVTGLSDSILSLAATAASTLYVGTETRGVFTKRTGEQLWSENSRGITNTRVQSLVVSAPGTLYAATAPFGFYRSDDHGQSWTERTPDRPPGEVIVEIAADPLDPSTVFVSIASSGISGIYKSTDGGNRWILSNTNLPAYGYALVLAIAPPLRVYAALCCSLGFLRSNDGGDTWAATSSPPGSTPQFIAIDPLSSTTLYAGGGSGLHKSTDGGDSWVSVIKQDGDMPLDVVSALAIDPLQTRVLYAATDRGIYKSTDAGAHWNQTALGGHRFVTSLMFDPRDRVSLYAVVLREGVFRSVDGGITFLRLPDGDLPNELIREIVIEPSGSFLHVSSDGAGVFDHQIRTRRRGVRTALD